MAIACAVAAAIDPLAYWSGSDNFLGAADNIVCASENAGVDFEAEIAVITSNAPTGEMPDEATQGRAFRYARQRHRCIA